MQWLNNIEESRIKSKYIVSAILALVYMIYAYIFPVPNIHVMEGGGNVGCKYGLGNMGGGNGETFVLCSKPTQPYLMSHVTE